MVVMDAEHFFPDDDRRLNQYDLYQNHYEYSVPITPPSSSASSPSGPHHPRPRRLLTSTATPIHHGTTIPLRHNAYRNYGLLITLDDNDSNSLCLQFCPDRNVSAIHPNSYAPSDMANLQKLGGGGSGVAVFAGEHPTLGNLVMKHGSDKDLVELFALSTVAHELQTRCRNGNEAAARHIQQRIPEFKMIYISPHHLGENRKALWQRLRELDKNSSANNNHGSTSFLLPVDELLDMSSNTETEGETDSDTKTKTSSSLHSHVTFLEEEEDDEDGEYDATAAEANFEMLKKVSSLQSVVSKDQPNPDDLPPGVEITKSGTVTGHRDIAIMVAPEGTTEDHVFCKLKGDSLRIVLPEGQFELEKPSPDNHSGHTGRIRIHGDGYANLKALTDDLLKLMKQSRWKFTMGQKRIGCTNSKTGNEWLYEARLSGHLLDNLVTQKVKLVRDLVRLTTDQEQSPKVLEEMREEIRQLEARKTLLADSVSDRVDDYVGNAIRKNFKAETGRIPVLLNLGERFREYSEFWTQSFLHIEGSHHHRGSSSTSQQSLNGANMILTPEEKIPAHHLGCVTKPGAFIGDTFQKAPMEPTVLENMGQDYWQSLLSSAVLPHQDEQRHDSRSLMVWKRLWTCGLADAGLHNLFVSESRLWLFDLGEPTITSVPGFLTKFLFSFFHTLGMQESDSGDGGMWVRRFEPNRRTRKLNLTTETTRLMAQAYKAFELALNRIVAELFNGDDSVRWLLHQYVTLQLISDASFCLQKWTVKGGGRARDMNHQENLEKWLWRALWDIYVACDINSTASLKRLKVKAADPKISDEQRALQERHIALIQGLAFEKVTVGGHGDDFSRGFLPFVNASG